MTFETVILVQTHLVEFSSKPVGIPRVRTRA